MSTTTTITTPPPGVDDLPPTRSYAPPRGGLAEAPQAVQEASDELVRLLGACRDARRHLSDLERSRRDAVRADESALAKAAAAGKPDPGDKNTAKHDDLQRAAHRAAVGLAIATGDAYQALRQAMTDGAAEWSEALADAEKASRATARDALAALVDAVADVERIATLQEFVKRNSESDGGRIVGAPGPAAALEVRGVIVDPATVLGAVAAYIG